MHDDGWQPLMPAEVAELFTAFERPWWLAGGHALELFAGRSWRGHGDIDVVVLRADCRAVPATLSGWQLWAADPPGTLRPWPAGEVLPPRVHDVWCRPAADSPWRLQVMIDESDGDEWVSRRDARIRRPLTALGRTSADGIPYVAPEVQLFYKSRAPRPRDELDFAAVRPLLSTGQRAWLDGALALTDPGNPWRERLWLDG